MPASKQPHNPPFPPAEAIAALRARLQGVAAAEVVKRYLPDRQKRGGSARVILGEIRRDLIQYARVRGRDDLAEVVTVSATKGSKGLPQLNHAIEMLRALPEPPPLIGDEVDRWLPAPVARVLKIQGINTLADLTVRLPRSRTWWKAVPGLGETLARKVEAFFAANPELTERARALVQIEQSGDVVPLERQLPRQHLDGSAGRNRAPANTCVLAADNDMQAIQAWLALHEAPATQRAYRKEAERVLLWAVVQLGKPLSSISTEEAIAYRAFLRDPAPRARWVGPHRRRSDPDWRPFTGPLTPRSAAYALTVVRNLFGWLVDQRYLMANPFSGVKVRGADKARKLDISHAFTDGEWSLVRTIANDLEVKHGWEDEAAHRARFLLDFSYSTGLRPGELVSLTLGQIELDPGGDWWVNVIGKGAKEGKVALPPLGLSALGRYLDRRGVTMEPQRWKTSVPVVATLKGEEGISPTRLWAIMHRTFETVAAACDSLQRPQEALAAKLRKASPHWMRHTHASHALSKGADLMSVRDNLRHASIATTSIYLRADEVKRARQMGEVFG
jgi:site-specific recombinase XerD